MELIDETLKNTVDNVDIKLNAALLELRNAIANAQAILESLVDSKIATHKEKKQNFDGLAINDMLELNVN